MHTKKRTRLPPELTLTVRRLIIEGLCAAEISRRTGVSKSTVANQAMRSGLKIEHAKRGPPSNHIQLRAIRALAGYIPNKSELARILGITPQAVNHALKQARALTLKTPNT